MSTIPTHTKPMRRVIFRPYRKGFGPAFTLTLFYLGTERIAYRLHRSGETAPLFEGADFQPSPCHPCDGDIAVRDLMNFLTLRPGDTDAEYFSDYTQRQLAFCFEHAEALGADAEYRFGE